MQELLLSTWSNVRAALLATIDKFTDEELVFRPAANGYSVAEIALHIANEEDGEIRFGLTRELPEFPDGCDAKEYNTKSTIVGILDEVHQRTLAYLDELTDHDVSTMVETPWGAKSRRAELLWHVIEHEIHHRGELSLMLGLLGREGLDA